MMVSDNTRSALGRVGTGRRSQLAEGPRRRNMNTNIVFGWRKQFCEGRFGNVWLPVDSRVEIRRNPKFQ